MLKPRTLARRLTRIERAIAELAGKYGGAPNGALRSIREEIQAIDARAAMRPIIPERAPYLELANKGNGYYHAGPDAAPLVVYRRYSGAWRILFPRPERGRLDVSSLRAARVAVELWVRGSEVSNRD